MTFLLVFFCCSQYLTFFLELSLTSIGRNVWQPLMKLQAPFSFSLFIVSINFLDKVKSKELIK